MPDSRFRDILERADREGSLFSDTNVRGAANAVYAMMRGVAERGATASADEHRATLAAMKQLIEGTPVKRRSTRGLSVVAALPSRMPSGMAARCVTHESRLGRNGVAGVNPRIWSKVSGTEITSNSQPGSMK